MIRIDRGRAAPGERWHVRARHATDVLTAKWAADEELRFDTALTRHADVTNALAAVFNGKCAYCESVVSIAAAPDLELFRPRAAAVDLNGHTDKPGYWWLAYSWPNIYLACQQCNRNKANRFPVLGERAHGPDDDLANEQPVLLDPCADEPAEHLVFDDAGRVASCSVPSAVDRGAVTIDVLGLNRAGLVQERRAAAEALRIRFELMVARGQVADDEKTLARLVDDTRPYVALHRQLAAQLIDEHTGRTTAAEADSETREKIFVWQAAHEEDLRRSSVEDNPNLESQKSQRIAHVDIENFRGIRQLSFDLGHGTPDGAGWTMLLGENGVGKSSVLQALAVALMGEERLASLEADAKPSDLLRRGSRSGVIRIHFAADAEPLEVRLGPDRIEFGPAAARPRMIVLGFGSSRWLFRPGGFQPDRGERIRVKNLFNPFVPLADTLRWLATLDPQEFARAEEALLRLLRLDEGEHLVVEDGEVLVRRRDEPIDTALPLRHLSDGYQAVVAMVGDIMELLKPKRLDMGVAEGLVLVDELEAHLHPRWKMQVVSRMRAVFPALQFVATTHDPLCLRGLHDGETLLLRRDSRGEVVSTAELPSVEALRVDQLLTSPYFGLHSTREAAVDARFDEYYDLLAKRRPTAKQRERIAELRAELDEQQMLGTDRRERLMLTAIDQHLAREADALADNRLKQLSKRTSDTLASILDDLDAPGSP